MDYRFDANESGVFRARLVKVENPDAWMHYWDGDGNVVFYDEGFRGLRAVEGAEEAETKAAMDTYREAGFPTMTALAIVQATEMADGALQGYADFVCVPLDRGIDLYVLVADTREADPYKAEIDAVWNGDIWCIESEYYENGEWHTDDGGDLTEYYGFTVAEKEFEKQYPLEAFPAELFV